MARAQGQQAYNYENYLRLFFLDTIFIYPPKEVSQFLWATRDKEILYYSPA